MSALRGIHRLKEFENAITDALDSTGLTAKYGNGPGIVRFVLTTTATMTKLNALHLHHEGPTDVITYNYFEDALFTNCNDDEEPVLAEIFICPDVARKYALQFNQPPSRELFLYAVHGLLHCAGEDDLTDDARISMRKAEARVMTDIEQRYCLTQFMN